MYHVGFDRIGNAFARTEFYAKLKPTSKYIHLIHNAEGQIGALDYTNRTNFTNADYDWYSIEDFVKEYTLEGTKVSEFWDAVEESIKKSYFEQSELEQYLTARALPFDKNKGILPVFNDRWINFIPANRYKRLFPFTVQTMAKYRVNMTVGKFLRTMFAGLSDAYIERIGNEIRARFLTSGIEYEIVGGEDIRDWYHEDRTSESVAVGSLGGSCMRYEECQSYLDLYVYNPEVCRMLIAKHETGLVGRALLWETNKGTVMDRIYASDTMSIGFLDYAQKHGWEYVFRAEDEYEVKLTNYRFDSYPYLDSFSFLKDGVLYTNEPKKPFAVLNSGEGDIHYEEAAEALLTVYNGDTVVLEQMIDIYDQRVPEVSRLPTTYRYTLNARDVSGQVDVDLLNRWEDALESGEYIEHPSVVFVKRSTNNETGEQTYRYNAAGVLLDILMKDGKLKEWEWEPFTKQIRKGYLRERGYAGPHIQSVHVHRVLGEMPGYNRYAFNTFFGVDQSFAQALKNIRQLLSAVESEIMYWETYG